MERSIVSLEGIIAQIFTRCYLFRDYPVIPRHVFDASAHKMRDSFAAYSEQLIQENNSLAAQVHSARVAYTERLADAQAAVSAVEEEKAAIQARLADAQREIDDLLAANRLLEAKLKELFAMIQADRSARTALAGRSQELRDARTSLVAVQNVAALALSAAGDEAAKAAYLERQIVAVARELADGELRRARAELEAFKGGAERRVREVEEETRGVLELYEARLQLAHDELEVVRQEAAALRSAVEEAAGGGARMRSGLEAALAAQAQLSAEIRAALQPLQHPAGRGPSWQRQLSPAARGFQSPLPPVESRPPAAGPAGSEWPNGRPSPGGGSPSVPSLPSLHLPLMQVGGGPADLDW